MGRQVVVLILLLCFIGAVIAGIVFGVHRVAWAMSVDRSVEWGTCHGFLQQTCTDVPLITIERDSGVTLPDTTTIVSSSSTGGNMFGDGSIRAELLLPAGASSPVAELMANHRSQYAAAWNPSQVLDELRARHLRDVQGFGEPGKSFAQGTGKIIGLL